MDSDRGDESRSLAELNEEERALSARRRKLHDRIDFLRAGGGGPVEEVAELLARLEAEEREVSAARRAIHARIDVAMAETRSRS